MALTETQKNNLLAEYKANGGKISKAAGLLDIDIDEAKSFIEDHFSLTSALHRRPELAKYVIAKRSASGGSWIDNDNNVAVARAEYDAGLIEMCQYKEGHTVYLLSIRRKVRADRVPHFSRKLEEEATRPFSKPGSPVRGRTNYG